MPERRSPGAEIAAALGGVRRSGPWWSLDPLVARTRWQFPRDDAKSLSAVPAGLPVRSRLGYRQDNKSPRKLPDRGLVYRRLKKSRPRTARMCEPCRGQ
jgi:hypothetical protein